MDTIKAILRLADWPDLEQINAIYNWAVENTVATFDLEPRSMEDAQKWFDMHRSPKYPVLVIEDQENKKILGWGSLSMFHTRPAYAQTGEFSVYLAPEERGKGYGTWLLEELLRIAQEHFHCLMGLICSENLASLNLATNMGFQQVGLYKEVGYKFGRWLDVAVVQKMFEPNRQEL